MARFIFILFAVTTLARVVRRLLAGQARRASAKAGQPARMLVLDPTCGTYIARDSALALQHQGQWRYFCSSRCQQRYLTATA